MSAKWKVHHLYGNCLVTVENPQESLLTVDEDGAATFLSANDCSDAVLRYNAHDDLVSALRNLLEQVESGTAPEFVTGRAIAALSKAEAA